MKTIYRIRKGKRISRSKAPSYGSELRRLADENGGVLTPQIVVESAKKPDSPLHDYFEWDNRAAADKWRLNQARNLIMSIEIVDGAGRATRIMYNIRGNHEREQAYVDTRIIQTREDLQRSLAEDCLCELEEWIEKYGEILRVMRAKTEAVSFKRKVKQAVKKI